MIPRSQGGKEAGIPEMADGEAKGINRPRKRKKPPKHAFKRLKSLECWPEVESKIKAGISPSAIAEWIQEDRLQMRDINRQSVVRQIQRYRAYLPPGELEEPRPLALEKRIEKLRRGVIEVEELEKLYLLQLTRISKNLDIEDKSPLSLEQTRKEVETAAKMLSELVEKKMELGLMQREPRKFAVVEGFDELDEDKSARLGHAAMKVLGALEKMVKDGGQVGLRALPGGKK